MAKEIGQQLRKHRKERGLTLKQAVGAIEDEDPISLSMLGQVEKDGQNTTLDKIEGVLDVLGLDVWLSSEPPAQAILAAEPPPVRFGLADRLAKVIDRVPSEDLEVLDRLIAMWERRYPE